MVDARFSTLAALACAIVAALAGARGLTAVAIVWGVLALGFALRAANGLRR